MASTGLPGKIIAPLGGRPLLAQLWRRIASARVESWWLATSCEPEDDVTEAWGFELGLPVVRSELRHARHEMARTLAIGASAKADWIVRVSANNPFVDASLIDALLDARDSSDESKSADLIRFDGPTPCSESGGPTVETGETKVGRLPVGYDAELLRGASSGRGSPPKIHGCPTPACWPERPDWRWTVETYEDLAMARSAFRVFGCEAETIGYPAMVAQLDVHPEIAAMNRHIDRTRDGGWTP